MLHSRTWDCSGEGQVTVFALSSPLFAVPSTDPSCGNHVYWMCTCKAASISRHSCSWGCTALFYMARGGFEPTVRLLIMLDSDVNSKTR
jgi:hypothetical protein